MASAGALLAVFWIAWSCSGSIWGAPPPAPGEAALLELSSEPPESAEPPQPLRSSVRASPRPRAVDVAAQGAFGTSSATSKSSGSQNFMRCRMAPREP